MINYKYRVVKIIQKILFSLGVISGLIFILFLLLYLVRTNMYSLFEKIFVLLENNGINTKTMLAVIYISFVMCILLLYLSYRCKIKHDDYWYI